MPHSLSLPPCHSDHSIDLRIVLRSITGTWVLAGRSLPRPPLVSVQVVDPPSWRAEMYPLRHPSISLEARPSVRDRSRGWPLLIGCRVESWILSLRRISHRRRLKTRRLTPTHFHTCLEEAIVWLGDPSQESSHCDSPSEGDLLYAAQVAERTFRQWRAQTGNQRPNDSRDPMHPSDRSRSPRERLEVSPEEAARRK